MTKIQKNLLKKLKAENRQLRKTVHLKCDECFGWFGDGYMACTSEICPLKKYYPTKGQYQSLLRTKEHVLGKKEAYNQG